MIKSEASTRTHSEIEDVGFTRRSRDSDQIIKQRLINRDVAHFALKREHIFSVHHRDNVVYRRIQSLLPENCFLVFRSGVTHSQSHHKSIELRFRQRVSSVMLDWVLGGEYDERLRQLISFLLDRDVTFSHRLEER